MTYAIVGILFKIACCDKSLFVDVNNFFVFQNGSYIYGKLINFRLHDNAYLAML